MARNHDTEAMCGFCGAGLLIREAAFVTIWPTEARDTSQSFYAHRKCLRERIAPGTPLHPSLFDGDDPLASDGG
jgi:hypothetical protein